MKKYLLGALLVLSLAVVPFVSQAATLAELQCQVYQLMSQIAQFNNTPCPTRDGVPSSCPALPYCQSGNRVIINSISGPTSLGVGEKGAWTINATVPAGTNVSYSVNWGENLNYPMTASSDKGEIQQTSTFTHSYSRAGTYVIKFEINSGSEITGLSQTVVVGSQTTPGVLNATVTSSKIGLAYEKTQNLYSSFSLVAGASGGDVYIPRQLIVGSIMLENTTHSNKTIPDKCSTSFFPSGSSIGQVPLIDNGYYKIANGQKYSFDMVISCPVKDMYKGVYYGRLNYINYYNSLGSDMSLKVAYPNYRTPSSQYIVGEQGPWISGVSFDSNSQILTINGERLKQVNSLTVGTLVLSGPNWLAGWVKKSDNQIVVQESKEWPNGAQTVFVGSVVGNSNKAYVTISDLVSRAPSIFLSDRSSNTGITVKVGDTFTLQGSPENLQGMKYWFGPGSAPAGYYTRAYFFDQLFDGSCTNNEASTNGLWTITCTAKTPGSGAFYVGIYTNGQEYRSNTVNVTVVGGQAIAELLAQIGALNISLRDACGPNEPLIPIPANPTVDQLRVTLEQANQRVIQRIYQCKDSTTPSFSNLQVDGDQATWAQNSSRNISWQTNGSIPKVDVTLCYSDKGCWSVQRGIPNTGRASAYFGSNVTVGRSIFVRVRESGKVSPIIESKPFTVTPSITSSNSSQSKLNQMASALSAMQAILDKLK